MNARALRQMMIVCRKELRDSLRDRRALFPIALAVLIYPALIALMMNRIAGRQRQAEEITLPVVGRENAPALVDWLSQQSGVRIVNGPADPEQEVREGRQSVVVIIPREFAEKFRVSRPAPVKIIAFVAPSLFASVKASATSRTSAWFMALRRSGRFSVIVRTPSPFNSLKTVS